MPWKYSGRIIRVGKAWVDNDGIQHPANWSVWDDDTKKAKGLTWEDEVAAHDNRFYWGRNADGELIPRSLTDVNEVDEDGKAILGIDGKQLVTLGLKSKAIALAKAQAASQLAPYDWYVTRKSEKSTAIPSDVTAYRDAVRTACANIEASINAVKTHAKFMALYDTPVDSDNKPTGDPAPINAWPDAI